MSLLIRACQEDCAQLILIDIARSSLQCCHAMRQRAPPRATMGRQRSQEHLSRPAVAHSVDLQSVAW